MFHDNLKTAVFCVLFCVPQRERTECISATRRKLKMRSDAVALAVSVEHDDEDDEERAEEDVPDSDLSKHPHDKPSVSGHEVSSFLHSNKAHNLRTQCFNIA